MESIKKQLRVSAASFDDEITELIQAALADLKLGGVVNYVTPDTIDVLVKRAVVTYCKAEFGLDNPDKEKYATSYKMLKTHLMLSLEYITPQE